MYTREEKKDLIQQFWVDFYSFCSDRKYLSRAKRHWLLHNTKVPNVQLKFDIQKQEISVAIEITHNNEGRRLEVYEKIEQCKSIVENGFDSGLIWNPKYSRNDGGDICRISTNSIEADFHNKNNWPEIFEFMARNMSILERNFIEIRDLLTNDYCEW